MGSVCGIVGSAGNRLTETFFCPLARVDTRRGVRRTASLQRPGRQCQHRGVAGWGVGAPRLRPGLGDLGGSATR